jgi:PKHD-type hydroxylase
MILEIAEVLKPPMVEALLDAAHEGNFWIDGKATAEGRARLVKRNEQAAPTPEARAILETAERTILAHEVFRSAAQPARLARLLLSRYRAGMEYGLHVDAPYIDDTRTDLSFTLFLSAPSDYDGGELVIEEASAEQALKPPAGAMVLYPSTSLHRVARVTRGERIAVVGWVKSRVRREDLRLMLFELERIGADLGVAGAPHEIRDRLANLRNNFLRAFGE